jgi:Ca2+-binding EF-hand superfamily protein
MFHLRSTEVVMTRFLIVASLLLSASAMAQQRGSLFDRADGNGDGSITRAELLAARNAAFATRDRNGDGYIDAADVPARATARPKVADGMARMRQLLDASGDGKISKEEFVNGGLAAFTRADTDGNDTLDAKEVAAARAAIAQRGSRDGVSLE